MNGLSIGFIKLENSQLRTLVTANNEVSCHVTLGDFERWPQREKCSLIYYCLISSEKTKVIQLAKLCRIMTYLLEKMRSFFFRELQLITVLLLSRTRFISLKLCVKFFIFDSVLFLFTFLVFSLYFWSSISMDSLTLKRHNSFQN